MQPADESSYLHNLASIYAGKAEEGTNNGMHSSSSETYGDVMGDELSNPKRRKCIDQSLFDPKVMHTDNTQDGEILATQGEPDLQGNTCKRDNTHIESDCCDALGTSDRLLKYFKQF